MNVYSLFIDKVVGYDFPPLPAVSSMDYFQLFDFLPADNTSKLPAESLSSIPSTSNIESATPVGYVIHVKRDNDY